MSRPSAKTAKEIQQYRGTFPRSIAVSARRAADGGFVAEILTFPGCFTEADTFIDLVSMVNDAVRTQLEVPVKYASFMPNYMPPVTAAQELDVLPGRVSRKEFKLKLAVGEAARR